MVDNFLLNESFRLFLLLDTHKASYLSGVYRKASYSLSKCAKDIHLFRDMGFITIECNGRINTIYLTKKGLEIYHLFLGFESLLNEGGFYNGKING